MSEKIRRRRKPRLDEHRVRGIAATYEGELNGLKFEIVSVCRCPSNLNEWQVLVKSTLPEYKHMDGADNLIMVNDRTGQARSYGEYQQEQLEIFREKS